MWIGRPFASARTCSFEFSPPFVRPIRRPRPLFAPRGLRPSGAFQMGRVDHHHLGVLRLRGQFGHDRGEHTQPPMDQRPSRADEQDDQGRHGQTVPLRQPRPAPHPPRGLPGGLKLCAQPEDPQRSHALRIHLQDLDLRAGSIHPRPDPPDAGTEQPRVLPLSSGNTNDIALARALVEAAGPAHRLISDRGYDANHLRRLLAERGTEAVIPSPSTGEAKRSDVPDARDFLERIRLRLWPTGAVPPGSTTITKIEYSRAGSGIRDRAGFHADTVARLDFEIRQQKFCETKV